jgi:hypothetical protein
MDNTIQFPYYPGIEGDQPNGPNLTSVNFGATLLTGSADYASDRDDRIHPLAYSPLTKSANDIADLFFTKARNYSYDNIRVVVDPTSAAKPEDIVVSKKEFYWDTNKKNPVGGEGDVYAFTLFIYISRDGYQLEQAYLDAKTEPKPKEIMLFLEDNSEDMSGACKWSKVGKYIKDNPKFFENVVIQNKNLERAINKEIKIPLKELQELLRDGKIENKTLEVIDALFKITDFAGSFSAGVLHKVADAVSWVVEKIENNCKFEEYHWNPKAQKKDDDGNVEKGYKFKPVLFPFSENLAQDVMQTLKDGIAVFETSYKQYDQAILQSFKKDWGRVIDATLFGIHLEVDVIPDSLQKLFQQKYNTLRAIVFRVLAQVKEILPMLEELIERGLSILNAFMCGIWNGFVDAICGIISLIGYVFEGLALAQDVKNNFKVEFPRMLEKIDNFTQAWDKISFTDIFKEAITGMKELLFEGGGIQAEEIAYFAGMFIGFIIELVVEIVGGILFTGGTVTVAAILEKLAAIPKGLASLAEGLVKGVFNTGKAVAKGLAKGFEWLISFLREGTENIIRLIREFFENLRKVKTEFLDDIPDLLATDLDWMKSKGTGKFGGRLLRAKDIRILRGILKEKGITLIVESDLKKAASKLYKPADGFETFKDLIYYMDRSGKVGAFNAANRQFILSKNATELVVFHEMAHANHFHQVGEAAYASLSKLDREMYVWEQIIAQKGRWTKAEIDDCLNYINGIRVDEYNLKPIIIK